MRRLRHDGAMSGKVELIGGIEKRAIVVVDYDPTWPHRFDLERDKIDHALGNASHRVDHVGSTAVPGLAAKPLIDIQLSVSDVDYERSYLPALERAGYILRVREPGHRMVRTPALDVHVHVCSLGSDWERRHLLLRNWLRESESDRRRYAKVKAALATQDWHSMNHYADAKTSIIEEITARAEEWSAKRAGV